MKMIDNSNEEAGPIKRRDFMQGVILAAGIAVVSPSLSGQTDKAMTNKYGLYQLGSLEQYLAQLFTFPDLGLQLSGERQRLHPVYRQQDCRLPLTACTS